MTKLLNRYASAINSDDLTSNPKTVWSDSDVVGAAGIASRHHPMAAALTRMLLGDKKAANEVVEALAEGLVGYAWRQGRQRLSRQIATEIAQAALAWHRFGTCTHCDGTGYAKVKDAPVRVNLCVPCNGTGRTHLEHQVEPQYRQHATWAAAEIDRRLHEAGPAAMRSLAPQLAL
jgi:hypothetical protein